MDLTTARTSLATAVDGVDGMNVYQLTDNPDTPCTMIYLKTPYEWRDTFDDHTTFTFTCLILVPYTDTDPAQDQLDGFIEDVAAAIETVTGASVLEVAEYQPLALTDGTRVLAAELVAEVR